MADGHTSSSPSKPSASMGFGRLDAQGGLVVIKSNVEHPTQRKEVEGIALAFDSKTIQILVQRGVGFRRAVGEFGYKWVCWVEIRGRLDQSVRRRFNCWSAGMLQCTRATSLAG